MYSFVFPQNWFQNQHAEHKKLACQPSPCAPLVSSTILITNAGKEMSVYLRPLLLLNHSPLPCYCLLKYYCSPVSVNIPHLMKKTQTTGQQISVTHSPISSITGYNGYTSYVYHTLHQTVPANITWTSSTSDSFLAPNIECNFSQYQYYHVRKNSPMEIKDIRSTRI